jgi:hypothetical protein
MENVQLTENTYQAAEKCVYTSVLAQPLLTRTTVPQHRIRERAQDNDTGDTGIPYMEEGSC